MADLAQVLRSHPSSRKRLISVQDTSKRHAIYFPARRSFDSKWNFGEQDKDCQSSAPVASYPDRDSCGTSSLSSSQSRADQDTVHIYYSTLLSGELPGTTVNLDSSFASTHTDAEALEVSPFKNLIGGANIRERESRNDVLESVLDEATMVMKLEGKSEIDSLFCHRSGCRNTVRNVRALMFHLHLHNIGDPTLLCNTCHQQFESQQQLNCHHCQPKSILLRSALSIPIKNSFRRAIELFGLPAIPASQIALPLL